MQVMSNSKKDFLKPFERIKKLMEHGPQESGSKKIVLITDPVDVQTVMHSICVTRNETMRSLAGDGLIFSDGKKWRERRRSLQPSFPPSKPNFHAAEVNWAVEGLMTRLRVFDETSETFPLLEELLRFTTRMIYKVAFGIELDVDHGMAPLLIRFFDTAAETSMAFIDSRSPVDINMMRQFPSARQEIDREIDSIIERGRRDAVGEEHVLGVLLRMELENPDFTDDDIRDELRSFLLAGAETASNVLTWFFLLMDSHPEQRQAIELELDTTSETTLLDAAILETTRLFPPVWFISREAIGSVTVSERTLEAGDWAFICTYLVQRNPDYWEEPNAFRPERFAPGHVLPHRYSWFPFGGGRHLCLGKALGELETFEAARTIMRSFRLIRSDSEPLRPRLGIVLKPMNDVPMRVEKRTPTV